MVQWGSQFVGKLQALTVSTADIPAFQNTVSPTNELSYLQVSSTGKAIVPRTASQVLTDIGVPVPAVANELDMIRVNAGGTAYEARTPAQVLTDIGAAALAGSASQNFSVADATTSHQAVAYEQVVSNTPVSSSNTTTGTTVSTTTGTYTAPCTGLLFIFGSAAQPGTTSFTSVPQTTSLAGYTAMDGGFGVGTMALRIGRLAMTSGQTTTITLSGTVAASASIGVQVVAFFLPLA